MKLYELTNTKFKSVEIILKDTLMHREYLIDELTLDQAKEMFGNRTIIRIRNFYDIRITEITIK